MMLGRHTLNSTLAWSAGGLACLAIVGIIQFGGVIGALFASGAAAAELTDTVSRLETLSDRNHTTDRERFDGRSVFTEPLPTPPVIVRRPPPPPPERDPQPVTPVNTGPPPPPPNYPGRPILAIMGDEIWFDASDGPERVKVGATSDKGEEILGINGPWGARIAMRGGEYDVPYFKRQFVGLEDKPAPTTDAPGIIEVETPDDDDDTTAATVATNTGETASEVARVPDDADTTAEAVDDRSSSALPTTEAAPGGRNRATPRETPTRSPDHESG